MTTNEAARILEVPPDATPEQLESKFLEARHKLEDKIAKAPTPGLQAKYRTALNELTVAFETLVIAADSSTLPVLQKEGTPAAAAPDPAVARPRAGSAVPAAPSDNPKSKANPRKSGTEFLVVAVIAISLLGAGGWFVMKTRADNADKARIAAEEQAALDRHAAEVTRAAEAERNRQEKMLVAGRTQLAEHKVAWDALEQRAREAERQANEARSELRSLRDPVPETKRAELTSLHRRHELFSTWLNQTLAAHPVKMARARAEQLLADKQADLARDEIEKVAAGFAALEKEIQTRAAFLLKGEATVRIESEPSGMSFEYRDAFGRTKTGVTPVTLANEPVSQWRPADASAPVDLDGAPPPPSVTFRRPGWPAVVQTAEIAALEHAFRSVFPEGRVGVDTLPEGIPFTITNAHGLKLTGMAPANVAGVPAGPARVTLVRPGFREVSHDLVVKPGAIVETPVLDQRSQVVDINVAEREAKISVDGRALGTGNARAANLTPGEHQLVVEAPGYPAYRTKFRVAQTPDTIALNYAVRLLAVEDLSCSACSGRGNNTQQVQCYKCRGRGWYPSPDCCDERGQTYGNFASGMIRCTWCGGDKKRECSLDTDSCRGTGVINQTTSCQPCAGDGKVSRLQLGI